MKKLLLFLLLIPALLSAQMAATKVFIPRAGGNIPAVKYLPAVIDTAKKHPLIVFLHGLGEGGDGTDAGLNRLLNSSNHAPLLKNAGDNGMIVFAPQFVPQYVNYATARHVPAADYFNTAIDWAIANLPVDPSRIHLTGLSAGGGACWNYVSAKKEYAAKIAAVIPVCGANLEELRDWTFISSTNLPVWAFHAKNDAAMPWTVTNGYVDQINKTAKNPAALMTLYDDGGHGIWGRVYGDAAVYKWMLAQKNDVVPVPPVQVKTIIARLYVAGLEVIVYSDKTAEVR